MGRLLATRRRKALAAVVGALVVTGSAIAAFTVFTGVDGSGQGTFAAAETSTAITINGTAEPVIQSIGSAAQLPVTATNNDPNVGHTLDTVTGTSTSTPSECADHMRADVFPASGILGSYAPGEVKTGTVEIVFLNTGPSSCAGGTWSVSFSGTTTP